MMTPFSRLAPLARWASLALGLFLLGSLPAVGQSSPGASLQSSDLFKVRTIEDVVISPTGRAAAYTVRRPTAGGGAVQTQLYVASLTGRGSPRLLTRSPRGGRTPTWGPDGNRIVFVRSVNGTPQLFLLSLSGGEPYQLTRTPHGATRPQWGPQGDRILFASAVPEPAVPRPQGTRPPISRPGRSPADTFRAVPSDTLLVLRHAQTLDAVDTLALRPEGPTVLGDSTRPLRAPSGPDRLRTLPVDSLRGLSPDSLRSVFSALRLRPDTTLVPLRTDTAATPDGDLLQQRRWLDQAHNGAPTLYTGTSFPQEPAPTSYRHYFVIDVPSGVQRGSPPAPSARPVTQGYRSFDGAAWLPGGSQLVVSGAPPQAQRDSSVAHALYVADLNRPRVQRLLQIDGYSLQAPRVTSDGTTIAFRARPTVSPSYAQTEIGLFSLDGRSNPQLITEAFDRDVHSLQWSPDGWYLYATAPSGTGHPLYRFSPFAAPDTTENARRPPALEADRSASRDTFSLDPSMVRTAPHERMTDSTRRVRAVDVTDAIAVYAAADAQSPSELYANTVSFGNERRLSAQNQWLADRELASTSTFTVLHDSLRVPGRLTRPVSLSDSLGAPLVVIPRGGPPPLARPAPPLAWFERHYLAAQGLAVVEVWPRGSAGQGDAYRRANQRDWGPGPFSDVQAVADSVASQPWIDGTQRAVAGHGYGATLTLWALAHTSDYQVGVAQNGVYDLASLLTHRATASLLPDQFGGAPWNGPSPFALARDSVLSDTTQVPADTTLSPRTALYRSSPLPHAHRIRTPLLLTDGAAKTSRPEHSGHAVYARLRSLNRPVEYARYRPPATPAQRRDRLVRLREFLARYLSAQPAARAASSE